MSFLKENKTAAYAFIILGAISLVLAVVALVGTLTAKSIIVSAVVACIGPIIMALLYFRFGYSIKNGNISKKIDILAYFVRLAGLSNIILAIFNLWANYENDGGWAALGSLIISIIIGLIILAVSGRINDGKQDTLDKIIWIILVVLFAISVIMGIFAIIGILIGGLAIDISLLSVIVLPIISLIIDLFMLVLLFDSDVKSEMNM